MTTYSDGVFTIDAAGMDIWGGSDQFQFVYQEITGDVDIRARVDAITATHAWAKAGVMIRGALTANAAHAYALSSAANGVALERRVQIGGLSTHTAGEAVPAPRWVRLVRAGSLVTAYSSPDGVTWRTIGSDTIALGAKAYVGLAVTSHHPDIRTTAVLSHVAVASLGLPAGLQSADVGSPSTPGSASYQQGTYTIRAAGVDIWDVADQFHYVYLPVTGNVDVTARVASLKYVHEWSKAGVMIRETLDASSPHAFALASAAHGYAFERRGASGALSEYIDGGAGAPPGWLRLVRSGSEFRAYRSGDGRIWTLIGTDTIAMAEAVYVGLAVTSHDGGTATTATIDNFTVTQAAPPQNQPPVVSLTGPVSGSTFIAPANVTVTAAASDPEGRLARVEFHANGVLVGVDSAAPFAWTVALVAPGAYQFTAVAWDSEGASSASAPTTISLTVPPVLPPRWVVFTASSDHDVGVTSYLVEVFRSDADPATSTPIAISDLGKPNPSTAGEIRVDREMFFAALGPGTYIGAVTAVGPGGAARSSSATFTR